MQRAKVVLKEAQMERLKAGKTVIIRLRDTEVELRHTPSLNLSNIFDELLRSFRR